MDHGTKDEAMDEAMILVVGRDTTIKMDVAEALARGSGPSRRIAAPDVKITTSGARIFTRPGSPSDWVVVSTTPLQWGGNLVDSARTWVSKNSLKTLSKAKVMREFYVVCIMEYSNPDDYVQVEKDSLNTWLHLLAYIFRGQENLIMMLVRVEDETKQTKEKIRKNLQRVGFAYGEHCFETFAMRSLQDRVDKALDHSCYPGLRIPLHTLAKPLRIPEIKLAEPWKKTHVLDFYGPWGPEKAILFGHNGSKKSMLARALTGGPGAGAQDNNETKRELQGGWYVVETVDLEEIFSASNEKEFVRRVRWLTEGIYTHFICVTNKDMVDSLHEILLEFLQIFFDYMSNNFTMVISDTDQNWKKGATEADKKCLRYVEKFKGCNSRLSFDPRDSEPVCKLEEELILLLRQHTICPEEIFKNMRKLYKIGKKTSRFPDMSSFSRSFIYTSSSKPTLQKVNTGLKRAAEMFLQDLYRRSRRAESHGFNRGGSSSSSKEYDVCPLIDRY